MGNLRDIKWFAEAWDRKVPKILESRDIAFSSVRDRVIICNVEVSELTLEAYVDLTVSGNPFVCGGIPALGDALAFIWRLSDQYEHSRYDGRNKRRDQFFEKILKLNPKDKKIIEECSEYVEQVFSEPPYGRQQDGVISAFPFASSVSGIVDSLASEYHWSEEDILNLTIRRTNQYLRRIAKRHNPDYIAPQILEKERAQALKELNEKNKNA